MDARKRIDLLVAELDRHNRLYHQQDRPEISDADALTAELAEFTSCIRTGQTPTCDGVAALAAVELAERVLQSLAGASWGQYSAEAV